MDIEDIVPNNDSYLIETVKKLLTDKRYENKHDLIIELKKYKVIPSMSKILSIYRYLVDSQQLNHDESIIKLLRTKNVRSQSGVVVITVFTSPYPYSETKNEIQKFSCEYDCHYCPKEPNQPRSYLLNEPGVLRANANDFKSVDQFISRAKTYIAIGHPLDKIELIISGGTFSSYPRDYIRTFIRDQFYAANTFYEMNDTEIIREPLNLIEEQNINQNISKIKIIGITIETRPDRIKPYELIFLRELGVTRVQIGVQHINNDILNHINRKCNNSHTIKAIKLLKNCGFKVDVHLIPDLPAPNGYTQEDMINEDKNMFDQFINNQEYQADQWKIYPCATVPWTKIEEWYKEGKYKPYGNSNHLTEMLINVKTNIKPWIRLNRIIRDIPNTYIIGGNTNTSMRGDLLNIMKKRGLKCNCIRCREIKDKKVNISIFQIKVRKYEASNGYEYFISWENDNELLLGFLRLRICLEENKIFPELNGCGLIRELHIYGQMINHSETNDGNGNSVQHIGLGRKLIDTAIEITKQNKLNKISVISGVGVKNYYIKYGFEVSEYFLIKNLD